MIEYLAGCIHEMAKGVLQVQSSLPTFKLNKGTPRGSPMSTAGAQKGT